MLSESRKAPDKIALRHYVFLFFLISVIVHVLAISYLKHAETYYDEFLTLQQAYSLANGQGLQTIYGLPYPNIRLMYSIVIAPACLVKNMQVRMELIAIINVILMNIGIFPIYGMAKRMLEKKSSVIAILFLYCIMPYQGIAATFTCDVLFYPLMTFLLYINYRILMWSDLSRRQKILYPVSWAILFVMAVLTKYSGVIMLPLMIATVLMLLYDKAYAHCERTGSSMVRMRIIALAVLAITGVLSVLLVLAGSHADTDNGLIADISDRIRFYVEKVVGIYTGYHTRDAVRITLYYICHIFLGLGLFPILVIMASVGDYKKNERRMLFLMTCLFIGLALVAVRTTFNDMIKGDATDLRAIMRYYFYMFMPVFVYFICGLERMNKLSVKALACIAGVSATVLVITAACYKGAKLGASTDHGLLHWSTVFRGDHRTMAVVLIGVYISAGLTLLFVKHKRFLICFLVLWTAFQIYNNQQTYDVYRNTYRMDPKDPNMELVDLVRDNEDVRFLIIDNYVGYSQTWRRGDTFLNTTNVYRSTERGIAKLFDDDDAVVDLTVTEIPGFRLNYYRTKTDGDDGLPDTYDPTPVDYLLISSELDCYPDAEGCEEVVIGDGTWYRVYRLNDRTMLPRLSE